MRKIVGKICPFTVDQSFFVYSDEELVARITINQSNFVQELDAAIERYKATQVDLVGSKSFNSGLKAQFEKNSKFKYDLSPITINII